MDFGALLHIAKKNNESSKSQGNFYCTKYAPPKKESKEKKLSDNIQKFLQKREIEEQERKREERQKVASLLAMRDEKAKNKIRKMLKVTKSANKSVLEECPTEMSDELDQDDYGYVSTEANAFYQKYIEKVKDVKEDKGFAPSRPHSLHDLSGTKERVKAAITREREEAKSHTRQRQTSTLPSSSSTTSGQIARAYNTSKTLYDPVMEKREEERKKREEEQKKSKARKSMPPPMDFQALLKLAEKKQHEPVEALKAEVKRKPESERPMSAREKLENEARERNKEDRARREREREREHERMRNSKQQRAKERKELNSSSRMESNGRIPKLNQSATTSSAAKAASSKSSTPPKAANTKSVSNSSAIKSKTSTLAATASTAANRSVPAKLSSSSSSSSVASAKSTTAASAANNKYAKAATTSSASGSSKSASANTSSSSTLSSSSSSSSSQSKNPYANSKTAGTREFPPRDMQTAKTRQFPPSDVGRRKHPPAPGGAQKRRRNNVIDDDFDSELDDFIDDGDCEEDISSHIRDIFGYDKRKYCDVDDDDQNMESSFAQMQREEFISKKLGLQEDLEDMRQEAIEKKRKVQKKRRLCDDDDDF